MREKWPQQPPDGKLPQDSAGRHGQQIPHADVPKTQPERQKQPAVPEGENEKEIGKVGVSGPEGTQKVIAESGAGTHGQAIAKPQGGQRRGGHPKIRRSQVSSRGCW